MEINSIAISMVLFLAETAPGGEDCSLRPVAETQLAQETTKPRLDGRFAGLLRDGDLLVGEALGEMLEKTPLVGVEIGLTEKTCIAGMGAPAEPPHRENVP